MPQFRIAFDGGFLKPNGAPSFPEMDLRPLEKAGASVHYLPLTDDIRAVDVAAADDDALILLNSRFGRDAIPAGDRLALVARFGVGYDNVDVAACTERDIAVVNAPSGVRRPMAVATMTYVLALSQNLLIKDHLCRQGPDGWARKTDYNGRGLVGRTLGILGLGSIGRETARLAAPFGLKVIAWDPYVDRKLADELGVRLVGCNELFRESDFVAVLCLLNDETRRLVNAERLAMMKADAYLISMARGPIVDQAALTSDLQERRIAGAALDVFEQEPAAAGDPLFALDNVIVSPHSLCWTDQMFEGLGEADVTAALSVMLGRVPVSLVNPQVAEHPGFRAKLARNAAAWGR